MNVLAVSSGLFSWQTLADEAAWCEPDQTAKMTGEMALVGKAGGGSNVRKRNLFAHPLLGPVDPDLRLVGVGRHAGLIAEHAVQMKRAEIRNAGQVIKRDGIGKMLVNERSYSSYRSALASSTNLRGTGGGTADDQVAHKIEERFFALQATARVLHDGVHAKKTMVRGRMIDFETGEIRRGQIAAGNLVRQFSQQLHVNVQAAKTTPFFRIDPVFMDLSRRGDDKIASHHMVGTAAYAEVAVPGTVGSQVKFLMPVARVRMSDIRSTIKQQAVKARRAPDIDPLNRISLICKL